MYIMCLHFFYIYVMLVCVCVYIYILICNVVKGVSTYSYYMNFIF